MCEGFGLHYAHGEKRRDLDAGACGPLGRWSGTRLHDACSLPLLLPRNDDGLRFGDDERRSPLLPVTLVRDSHTTGPRGSSRASDWGRAVVRFRTSARSRPPCSSEPTLLQSSAPSIAIGRRHHPSNLIVPSIP